MERKRLAASEIPPKIPPDTIVAPDGLEHDVIGDVIEILTRAQRMCNRCRYIFKQHSPSSLRWRTARRQRSHSEETSGPINLRRSNQIHMQ